MAKLTPKLRAEMWKRFQAGLPFKRICEGLGVTLPTVWTHITVAGGFAPRPRRRRAGALTVEEREEVSRGLAGGESFQSIGRRLGRPASTICREVERNGGRATYRAAAAESRAWNCAQRPQVCKLARVPRLRRCVARKLRRQWSPQQVTRWLRQEFPDDERMKVSHETIYRSLYVQARGAFRDELKQYLRQRRTYRRPRSAGPRGHASVVDGVSISQRPAEVEDRAVPGHWESDLILGTVNSYIATLVERTTRFVMLAKVKSKDTKTVLAAIAKVITRLPEQLRKTVTFDRGSEFAGHKEFAVTTGVDVFFCDPHSPWQRGSNENTNGLLRGYFPRGEDVSKYSQRQLDRVARELNERPRETLGWRSPAQVLNQLLQ